MMSPVAFSVTFDVPPSATRLPLPVMLPPAVISIAPLFVVKTEVVLVNTEFCGKLARSRTGLFAGSLKNGSARLSTRANESTPICRSSVSSIVKSPETFAVSMLIVVLRLALPVSVRLVLPVVSVSISAFTSPSMSFSSLRMRLPVIVALIV